MFLEVLCDVLHHCFTFIFTDSRFPDHFLDLDCEEHVLKKYYPNFSHRITSYVIRQYKYEDY